MLGGDHDTLIYVGGRKGCGKSTLLRSIAIQHAREGCHFYVWDSTREWSGLDYPRIHVRSALVYDVEEVAAEAIDRRATLVVDEIDRVAPPTGGLMRRGTNLHSIVHYGRHLETALLCAARRPAGVHKDIIELANTLFLVQHSGVNDCKYVRDSLGPETEQAVRALEPGQFLRRDL